MKYSFKLKLILFLMLFFTTLLHSNEKDEVFFLSASANYKYSFQTGQMFSLEADLTFKRVFVSFEGGKVLNGEGFELYDKGGDGLYYLINLGVYFYKGINYDFSLGLSSGKGYPDKKDGIERDVIGMLSFSLNMERKINKYNIIAVNAFLIAVESRAKDLVMFLPLPGIGIKYILRY